MDREVYREADIKIKYRLAIDVELSEENVESTMAIARECYRENGGARGITDEGSLVGEARDLSPEEFIDDIDEALMELVEANPLLKRAKVEITSLSAGPAATE